jgi:hypothetical protein
VYLPNDLSYQGTKGPIISRTQQKVLLQKDQLETLENSGPSGSSGSDAVKFAKEIERITREYDTIVRFHDPIGAAQLRKTVN